MTRCLSSISVCITIILSKLVFFVWLDVFLTDAAFDAFEEVLTDLFTLDFLIENELEFDFLGQLVQLELPVVA